MTKEELKNFITKLEETWLHCGVLSKRGIDDWIQSKAKAVDELKNMLSLMEAAQ